MDERKGMNVQPKIQVMESYYVEDGANLIAIDDVPVYYVTRRESFRIPVKIISRKEEYSRVTFIVTPKGGEGQFEVSESEIEIDLAEYYA